MIEISVNLATHNRAAYLEACLVSLCEQTLEPSRYEICVVNNACTDATSSIVSVVAARYPQHHVFEVSEPVAGLSRARNRGIAATSAPLIADIDDDATANRDWLECFVLRFAELPDTVAAIGGEINPVWQASPPQWLDAAMKGILSAASNLGIAARYIDPQEGLLECNTCYRRAALASVGNFPVELGRVNNLLLSGEGAVNAVIRHKGFDLFFEPTAIINHVIHAERLTPRWLRKRMFWQGVSDYAMHCYYRRYGLKTNVQLTLELPLDPADWAFIERDSAENLSKNIKKFESLGFVLAMSGIIQIEPNVVINPATQAEHSTPKQTRKEMFWQGASDCAGHAIYQRGERETIRQICASLPLDGADWAFINQKTAAISNDNLKKFERLGFVLAMSGIITVGEK